MATLLDRLDGDLGRRGHGLILGKFLPPHAGHLHLVDFGRRFAARLTVLVCSLSRDPIPGALRLAWMRELAPDARVVPVADDALPQEPSEHPDFWPIWRRVCRDAAGPAIDWVFASEPYGARLAAELGATFIPVDLDREAVPVSGSAVRTRPMANWRFIPDVVRPHFVRRVCLFGPESTGKSTLARDLARRFGTVHVPEFARGWLDPKGGRCDPEDLPMIVRGQRAAEEAIARRAEKLLFLDTDALLTTVWAETLFGPEACPPAIRAEAARARPALTLLLDVDLPWADDGQRFLSAPADRHAFLARCRDALDAHDRRYVLIQGIGPERLDRAAAAVAPLLDDEGGGHDQPVGPWPRLGYNPG